MGGGGRVSTYAKTDEDPGGRSMWLEGNGIWRHILTRLGGISLPPNRDGAIKCTVGCTHPPFEIKNSSALVQLEFSDDYHVGQFNYKKKKHTHQEQPV